MEKSVDGSSVVLAGLTLGACSNDNSNSTSSNDNKKPITLWVATDYVPWYKTSVKQFEKKYPQYKVKVAQSPNGTANAKTDVGKDPTKAAQATAAVKNDKVADAVMTMSKPGYSVIMPKMPQITTFWNESAPLLSGVYDHKVKPAQYRAKLAKLQKDISKK